MFWKHHYPWKLHRELRNMAADLNTSNSSWKDYFQIGNFPIDLETSELFWKVQFLEVSLPNEDFEKIAIFPNEQ